jgi:hypothetical protein
VDVILICLSMKVVIVSSHVKRECEKKQQQQKQ